MTWLKNNLWVLLAGMLMSVVAQIILICLMWTGSNQGHSAFMILPLLLAIGCVIALGCVIASDCLDAAADDDSDWSDWSEDDG